MRSHMSYRGYRRNHYSDRDHHPAFRATRFAGWNNWQEVSREVAPRLSSLANGAREAAAKALVEQKSALGSLSHLTQRKAMDQALLAFYLKEKRTRPVNRFIRELRHAVRA